ncbi:MAG: TolC family protein [Verrucomicrobia bacterium]|nr:TolC family protein [Verrucomicrobiota bacterium]
MKLAIGDWRLAIGAAALTRIVVLGWSQEQPVQKTAEVSAVLRAPGVANTSIHAIDLATVLRLAGAQNLDVQIARERLAEAKANHSIAMSQFFPWLAPGVGYRRHEDRLQDVVGNVFDADKQSYVAGGTLAAQWDFGEALYRTLAAKQLANAAAHGLDAQRQESAFAAVQGYFELLYAQASVSVAEDTVRISENYLDQVQRAVEAGIAFKGDELRVQVQAERNRLIRQQSREQHRFAAARLAQILHLDPAVELRGADGELVPLGLIATNTVLSSLVQEAIVNRPDAKQSQSLIAAAEKSRSGVTYGPWIPSVGAQAFVGGLGGGRGSGSGNFGATEDYALTLGWRIGPGGLFDQGRKRSAESRLNVAKLGQEKLRDEIVRQVIEAHTRFVSLADQIAIVERALKAAERSQQLAQDRKQFGVGAVLETIQAEQDLTRARLDYAKAIADFDRAQYALSKAIGKL